MSEYTQRWYQNPDLSLVYEIHDDDNVLVGFGGEKMDGATLVDGPDELQKARESFDRALDDFQSGLESHVDDDRSGEQDRQAIVAAAAASAYEKLLSEDNPIAYTDAEASVITGYWPGEET